MQERLLNRLEQVENLGRATLATTVSSEFGGRYVDSGKADGFKAASLSFIERVYGKDHSYYESFNTSVSHYDPSDIESGLEILSSIRQEIEGDWLFTLTMWLDLRNKAAHGKYDEYKSEQVANMYSGITEFMARLSISV